MPTSSPSTRESCLVQVTSYTTSSPYPCLAPVTSSTSRFPFPSSDSTNSSINCQDISWLKMAEFWTGGWGRGWPWAPSGWSTGMASWPAAAGLRAGCRLHDGLVVGVVGCEGSPGSATQVLLWCWQYYSKSVFSHFSLNLIIDKMISKSKWICFKIKF